MLNKRGGVGGGKGNFFYEETRSNLNYFGLNYLFMI